MSSKSNRCRVFLAIVFAATGLAGAYAVSSYVNQFKIAYPAASTSSLADCVLCHNPGSYSRNTYGTAFSKAGNSYKAIEGDDSDGDGFSNFQEINALTFPGDSSSKPSTPPSDAEAPVVGSFTIPGESSSLTVAITTLSAMDNVGVTGYLVTESVSAPSASAAGWSASAPASHTFGSEGAKVLYAWAKDAAGNVSASRSATTTITLPPAADTTAPAVTTFSMPAASSTLTVAITTLSATDNVGVTGYLVTESANAPSSGTGGWSLSPPVSYMFSSPGSKTLYAWARDAAGNVSNPRSASTSVAPPGDTISGMDIWIGRWLSVKISRDAKQLSWKEPDEGSDDGGYETGYLHIRHWDPDVKVLQASFYYLDRSTATWELADLPLHFTAGSPRRFLFWFEYAGEFQFAAGMIAKVDQGVLLKAQFSSAGIYLLRSEEEMDDDVNISLLMGGMLIPDWEVPPELLSSR